MRNTEYNFRINLIQDLKGEVEYALYGRGYDIDTFGSITLIEQAVAWASMYARERGCSELVYNAIQNELMRYYNLSAYY